MAMAILRAAALSSHLQLAVLLVLLSALPPTRAATPAAGNALASYTDYATQRRQRRQHGRRDQADLL